MLAVGDDFCRHFVVSEDELLHAASHRSSEASADARNGTHGAPKMIDMAHAGVVGMGHLGPTGIGMPTSYEAAAAAGGTVKIDGAREFGGAGSDSHDT